MRQTPLFFSIAFMAVHIYGSIIPNSDAVAVPRDTSRVYVSDHAWTTKDIAINTPFNVAADSSSVIMAIITSNTAIATAACTAAALPACIVAAVFACLTNFYLAYKATAPADPGPQRRIEGVESDIHSLYLPSESETMLDKLRTHTIEGQWTHFGNTTVYGLHHDMQFQRQGSKLGIKAIPRAQDLNSKRDDVDDDGGIVTTYFWEDNNQQAWNDWNNAQVEPIAQIIADYIVDHDSDIMCADIIDQDGPMDVGVFTTGLNNDELGLTQSEWTSAMDICLAGLSSTP